MAARPTIPTPPSPDYTPNGPVRGADGSIWITADDNHEVWRIDPGESAPALDLVADLGAAFAGRLVPADGDRMWSANSNNVSLLDPDGTVDTFATGSGIEYETALGGAPDGALWFSFRTDPFYGSFTRVRRVGVDGVTSDLDLETSDDAYEEDLTSLAFADDGTLWYTTYNHSIVTLSGASGGGIGRYRDGASEWWPRPDAPVLYEIGGETTSGPLPQSMQAGPDGWMYFAERSPRGRNSLTRIGPSLRVQYVELPGFGDPRILGDTVWLRGGPGFGRGHLSRLFEVGVAPRRVSLRHKTRPEKLVGVVRSINSGCQRAKLRVYRIQHGDRVLVRQGRSKANGRFSLRLRHPEPGRYWVKAVRAVDSRRRHDLRCRPLAEAHRPLASASSSRAPRASG